MASTKFSKPVDEEIASLSEHLASKTGIRSAGLVAKNTQINLTDDEKSAKLLIVHFARYGFVQTAIFTASVNYLSVNYNIPSFGTNADNIKIVATGNPVTSISFTGTDTEQNVLIIRIM